MMFSIIIPMYNVAPYIERCLQFVFDQNISSEDYEVIMINDGSPDNCEELAQEYCKGRSNVKIIRQENKGLGGARNTGIENAKGKFVIFLDADDVISQSALSSIDLDVLYLEPDIIELSYKMVSENLSTLSVFEANSLSKTMPGKNYHLNNNSDSSVCNKIYLRSFLNKNNLRFKEHIYIEDVEFNTRAIYFASKMLSLPIHFQSFVQTQGSIIRKDCIKTKQKIVSDIIKITKSILEFKETQDLKETSDHYYFNERLSFLNVNAIYQAYKHNFSREEVFKIISDLKANGLYFMEYKIIDKRKNLFRYFVHHYPYIFNLLLKFKRRNNVSSSA